LPSQHNTSMLMSFSRPSKPCTRNKCTNNLHSIWKHVSQVPCSRTSRTTSPSMLSQLLTQLSQAGPPIVHLMIRLMEDISDHVSETSSHATGWRIPWPLMLRPGLFSNNLKRSRLQQSNPRLCNGVICHSQTCRSEHSRDLDRITRNHSWERSVNISTSLPASSMREFHRTPEMFTSTISSENSTKIAKMLKSMRNSSMNSPPQEDITKSLKNSHKNTESPESIMDKPILSAIDKPWKSWLTSAEN